MLKTLVFRYCVLSYFAVTLHPENNKQYDDENGNYSYGN